jgi:hypothetical protein
MGHQDRSIHKRVIGLAERGISSSSAGELYGVSKYTARTQLQKHWRNEKAGRRRGTGLWRESSIAQDAELVVAEAQRIPSITTSDHKTPNEFPGQKNHGYFKT